MIAEIEQLVECKSLLAHSVEPHINLQTLAALLQRSETSLALRTHGHQPAGNRHRDAIGIELFARHLVPLRADLRNSVRCRELIGVGSLAQLLNLG